MGVVQYLFRTERLSRVDFTFTFLTFLPHLQQDRTPFRIIRLQRFRGNLSVPLGGTPCARPALACTIIANDPEKMNFPWNDEELVVL